jgi:O-antigen/teichoic acid export membrane protein
MIGIFQRMWLALQADQGILARLRRGTIEAFILQGAGMGLLALMQIILGRQMGTHDFGIFSYALAACNVLAVVAALGWPVSITRFIAQYTEQREWRLLLGVIRRADQSTLFLSLLIAVGLWAFTYWSMIPASIVQSLRFAALLFPLYAFVRLRSGAFKGLLRIRAGLILEQIALPVLVIAAVFLFSVKTVSSASVIYLACTFLVLLMGNIWFRRAIPKESRQVRAAFDTRNWMLVAIPLVFGSLSLMVMSRVDVLVLGIVLGPAATGVYSASARMATMNAFVLGAANTIAAPMIAAAFHGGHSEQFKMIIRKVTLWSTLGALPLFLVMIFWPQFLLSLFGPGFMEGATVLRILAIGQFINAATGPVGFTLQMTGRERTYAWITLILMAATVVGDLWVIPIYGEVGAAVVTASGEALKNLFMYWQVRRHYTL